MDPFTIGAVLAAVAGGAGGTLGAQVWAGISALVRRPFRHRLTGDSQGPGGEVELQALTQSPGDLRLAVELAQVLVARADDDAEFARGLTAWWEQASQVTVDGDVSNTVSGGMHYGPLLQGRDFSNLNFGPALAAPVTPPPDAGGT